MFDNPASIEFIESILFERLGSDTPIIDFQFIHAGHWSLGVRVATPKGVFFIKWNEGQYAGMFEAEAKGLALLQQTKAIAVPEVIGVGKKAEKEYLMMEWIASGYRKANYWQDFGQKLATLHRQSWDKHGLWFDNYIGGLIQANEPVENGIVFFIEKRLKVQVGLSLYEGKIMPKYNEKFNRLYEKLPDLIPNEKPALLHGDLWDGNVVVNNNGFATLIDPAVYYGLRESELAFSTLFNRFDTVFYNEYNETFPLEPNFRERIPLYNLYPLMVHVNLFGKSYLSAVERILSKY